MSGDTSGLRNSPWNAVPATASAAPTRTAATTRGPRTCRMTLSATGETPDGAPVSLAPSRLNSSPSETGYRPTVKASSKPASKTVSAIAKPGRAERVIARSYQSRPASTCSICAALGRT